ncbi:MAG: hypothetical protein IIA51_05580 [Chloroflexi bacterium]|nr:hypothetical protein [Chloroflexota bacterium]
MSSVPTHLESRGRWIRLARIFWVILALVYFGLFIAAFPAGYTARLVICEGDNCLGSSLTAEEADALEDLGLSHQFYAGFFTVLDVLLLTWAATGLIIFLRRSGDWIGLLVSMALIAIGINGLSDNVNLLIKQIPAFTPLYNLLGAVGIALMILVIFVFPDGRFVPSWTRYVAIPLVVVALADPLLALVLPPLENTSGTIAALSALLIGFAVGAIAQIQRFRNHSNLEQRQQTKWVIFGFLTLLLVALIWTFTVELFPPPPGPGRLYFTLISFPILLLLLLALPITMTMSILRYRLFDIDIVIKRTAVYGALTIVILIIYFVTVLALQSTFRALTGRGDQLAIVASTLLIAALFNPLRGRIQTAVNRRFFRGDYDAAQALSSFAASVQDEVDIDRMQAALLTTVEETMQPGHVSLWLKESSMRPNPER